MFPLLYLAYVILVSFLPTSQIDLVQHGPTRLITALKVFKKSKDHQADVELRILERVSASPFLLHCYDAFISQGCRCLVLQYAPFGNLDNLTRTIRGLGSDTMRLYAMEIAQALDFLHSHSIIHRDVKPENVLILWSGHVVLADFNIAFQMTSDTPGSTQMCGTFLTRPPEVWASKLYNQTIDIWMYGISLYNIASNAWPFVHASRFKQVEAVKSGLVKFNDSFFSTELIDLIQQTLRVDSSARIPTANILHHSYFTASQLLSLVVTSSVEREIIQDILQKSALLDLRTTTPMGTTI